MNRYRSEPLAISGNPPGIAFIIGNEAAERFSYYGMRAVLVIYMTQYLIGQNGQALPMTEQEASGWFHLFVSATYFTPLIGALLADVWLGKYRTILLLSLVYCLGHLVMAVDDTRLGLLLGQSLIALGAGGIKPCVSAHVGDQFADTNRSRLSITFSWFYLAINVGAFSSMLVTPWLMNRFGPAAAFGVPGILMLVATVTFWSGRFRYAHIPAAGLAPLRDALSAAGRQTLGRLVRVYAFVAIFWSLFDQTGSSWILQARHMDPVLLGVTLLPSQIQAANPLLILVLTPVFFYVIYPKMERIIQLTLLRRIRLGMLLASSSFFLAAWLQMQIDDGHSPSIAWQLAAYLALTAAEVMVSITALEYSYTQAPKLLKSMTMAFYMLSVSAGNLFTSLVNFLNLRADGSTRLAGADYFWFFAALMLGTALLFGQMIRDPETAESEPLA